MAEEKIISEEAQPEVSEQELDLVRQIFVSFTKTIKTFSAYPKDNPIYQKFSADLLDKFDQFFNEHDTLELDIDQMSVIYKGKEVFTSDDRKSNIAFLLFVDGIRKISFTKGLTLDEIIGFIDVLRVTPKEENLEDDIVTLLWEKDLEHFTYYVPEHVGAADYEMEEEIFPDLATAIEGGGEPAAGAGGSGGPGAGPQGGLSLALSPGDYAAFAAAKCTDEEVQVLYHEAEEQLAGENLLSSSISLFLELFSGEADPSVLSDLSNKIMMAVDLLVEGKNIRAAIGLLRRLRSLYERAPDPRQKEAIEGIVTRMGGAGYLRALSHDSADMEMFGEYVALLNDSAVPNLLNLLGETENRKLRRTLLNALVPFASRNPDIFLHGLRDQRWFLVRNTVAVLGASKNQAAAKLLERVAAHREDKVRLEVLRAFKSLASTESVRPLKKMLFDPLGEIRVGALKLLLNMNVPDLYQQVLDIVRGEGFHKKEMTEKRAFMEALGQTGREAAFPTLAGLFGKKSLFHRDENAETRACAAYGLGAAGTPEAVKLIKAGASDKNSAVRAACVQALQKLGAEGYGTD